MAGGKTWDTVSSTLLRIDTEAGISGWGEVCPIPHYLPAYAGGVRPAIEYLAPVLIGADPIGNTPEQMARQIKEDTERFARMVKEAKVVLE